MTRVLVCGGRRFDDEGMFLSAMNQALIAVWDQITVIHGAASGADSLADKWARLLGWPVLEFPADWQAHGKAAGPIRNQRMLDEGRPDLVVAFPGGRGTADMVRRAKAAGVEVIEARRTP